MTLLAHNIESLRLDTQAFSQLLKACGDPLRVQILQVLKTDTFGVLELTQIFATKQSGMSHHLKVLSKVGLVEAQREGNSIFYRRPFSHNDSAHDIHAIEHLLALIDRFPLSEELNEQIAIIRKQRAAQCQDFFARNAARFKEQQELICDYHQYAGASFELLKKAKPDNNATILELGPGEGEFLKRLAHQYKDVIALDNSQEMLNKAKAFADRERLENISFILGDSHSCEQLDKVDAVIMNMVLHHVPTPAEIFQDCATILKPSGVMVVCDLSRHDQEWAKESCGDLWLGFESQELTRWAKKAGLDESESLFIGLRNGFQIQLRQFIKPDIPH